MVSWDITIYSRKLLFMPFSWSTPRMLRLRGPDGHGTFRPREMRAGRSKSAQALTRSNIQCPRSQHSPLNLAGSATLSIPIMLMMVGEKEPVEAKFSKISVFDWNWCRERILSERRGIFWRGDSPASKSRRVTENSELNIVVRMMREWTVRVLSD